MKKDNLYNHFFSKIKKINEESIKINGRDSFCPFYDFLKFDKRIKKLLHFNNKNNFIFSKHRDKYKYNYEYFYNDINFFWANVKMYQFEIKDANLEFNIDSFKFSSAFFVNYYQRWIKVMNKYFSGFGINEFKIHLEKNFNLNNYISTEWYPNKFNHKNIINFIISIRDMLMHINGLDSNKSLFKNFIFQNFFYINKTLFSSLWYKMALTTNHIPKNMGKYNYLYWLSPKDKNKFENIYLCFKKDLFLDLFLNFWKFINKILPDLLILEYKNKFKKYHKQTKIIKKTFINYKVKEFDFININRGTKQELFDFRIYYKYCYKDNSKEKRWIWEYKKSNCVNWNKIYTSRQNWNWYHKSAYIGKMFQNYINKNEMIVIKNIVNIEGYNKSQPDFFFVYIFMYVFKFDIKNPKIFSNYLWKNKFVKYDWYDSWGRLPAEFCPIDLSLNNKNNEFAFLNKSLINKKYFIDIEFKYFEII